MAYNPFDDVIDQDPAYMAEGGGTGTTDQTVTKTAYNQFGQPIMEYESDPRGLEKFTRDMYGLVLGEEDPYANKKLERELSVALAQKEAGLPVDPNKSFVTSAERQDPVLGPALDKFKFEPMGLGEFGERAMEFLYRDQEKARSKQLRGEELTLGEKIAANPFMAALDAADFAGLIGLATKAGIKFSAKGIQTLKNLQNQGASNQVINQIMTTQFPDDAQKIGLVYYQTNRPPGMETSQLLNKADDGGSSMPKGLQIGHEKASARRLESKNKLLKVINEAKQSEKKYKQKLDIYKEAGISKFVGKSLGDEFPEIRQATDFLINKPDKPNKDVVLNFLKQDPNKKYTIKEIAESTGLSYQQVNKVKEMNRKQIENRFVSPKDEGTQRRNDMREYLNNIPEGSYVPSDFLAKEFNTTANEVGVFLQNDPQYRNKVRMANTFDFGFDRGFETVPQFLMKYMDDTMNDGRFHYRDEILDVDFNGNKISGKQLSAFFQNYKDYKKYFAPTEFQQKGKGRDIPRVLNENKEELGYEYVGSGPRRAEYNFLYDYLRSANPNLYPDFKGSKAEFLQMLVDDLKSKNWKELYREDINTIRELDILREQGTQKIKNLFETYSEQYPQQFKNLDKGDFVLHLAHNFPLQMMRDDFGFAGSLKGSTRLSLARTNLEHHREIEEEIAKIVKEVNEKYVDKGVGPQQRQTIPPEINKKLAELDKKANKLGTVVYFKFGNQQYKVGNETPPSVDDLVKATEKYFQYVAEQKAGYKPIKTDKNFGDVEIPVGAQKEGGDVDILTKAKGGEVKPVRMAMGGDPLENLNQQQFTSDPAVDDDYFAKAVQDENLYAFNPTNLFKIFNKVPAMLTPKKTLPDMPTSEFTPVIPTVDPGDFPFKSYFLSAVTDPNTPKAARPQDWLNYFKGKGVKESELSDIGITQYFEDVENFVPGSKVRKEDLVNLFEQSPISNIEIKVKEGDAIGDYGRYVGEPKHGGMGNAPIDNQGQNYRNIIINSPKLPGEKEPFFNTTHYPKDPNVLAFARVADYQNTDGQTVAVIQELQSDLLNNLRKEQERVGATVKIIRRKKAELQEQINNYPASNSWYQEQLDRLEQKFPESKLKYIENNDLVRPIDPIFAEKLAPELTKELSDIQDQINKLTLANRDTVVDPDYTNKIVDLQQKGMEKFQQLYDLNRQANHDLMFEDFKVMSSTKSDEIRAMGERESYIPTDKNVQTFPRVPFNKGKDWIDLIIKGTIQDAQSKGINKVAIMPSDIVNQRWSKDINSPAAEKFKTLYDNISVQQLKEIAKKYTGNKNNLTIEKIVDPSKADKGLTFFNKSPDGEYQVLKQLEVKKEIPINERDDFYDEEIARIARNFEDKSVVYSREIAPGQTMDYYVIPTTKGDVEGYKFVPLGDGDNVDDALLKIEEYNPSAINMYTLTLPEESTKKGPMFLYGKKDGGKISSDGLVSITDIYGDY